MAKTRLAFLAVFALWCFPVQAERVVSGKQIRTLDAGTVRELEARLKPPGGKPLSDYVRYYTRIGDYDSPIPGDGIRGVLLCKEMRETPGAHIVPNSQMPLVMDGGCCVIELYFDFQKQEFTR